LNSVNQFLEGKTIESRPELLRSSIQKPSRSLIVICFEDGSVINSLRVLSSGERQIVTLIYAATHMSSQRVVLIDEPEISLHVDWQRHLISRMSEQLGERQIIACTHSPVIGAEYEDRLSELNVTSSRNGVTTPIDTLDEESAY
jgi:predicted ATPase